VIRHVIEKVPFDGLFLEGCRGEDESGFGVQTDHFAGFLSCSFPLIAFDFLSADLLSFDFI
jgi:hypothetical protein